MPNATDFQDALKSAVTMFSTTALKDDYKSHESLSSLCVAAAVGKGLLTHRINVLDIGSGRLHTARHFIEAHGNIGRYTCIDFKVSPHEHVAPFKHCITDVEYIAADADEDATAALLGAHTYDVVIMDVEPHAGSNLLYHRFKPMLAQTHLCLLKHEAYMDIWGSYFADTFLQGRMDEGVLHDYFACRDCHKNYRDVYAILSQDAVPLTPTCQDMVDGETYMTGNVKAGIVKHVVNY